MNTFPEKESATENLIKLLIFLNALALLAANRNSLPNLALKEILLKNRVAIQIDTSPTLWFFPDLVVTHDGPSMAEDLVVACPNGVVIKNSMVKYSDLPLEEQLNYTRGLSLPDQDYVEKNKKKISIANGGSVPHVGCSNPGVYKRKDFLRIINNKFLY